MCPSWLKEMRGPQYGDLQWVLGMHRDRHLHFPNGNSARQDLGGEEVLEAATPVATGQGPTTATKLLATGQNFVNNFACRCL